MTSLMCPKCQAEMRQYERSGITVDQCSSCQGLFLDRGELERLMEAETAYYGRPAAAAAPAPTYAPPPPQGYPAQGYPAQGGFLGGLFGGQHGGGGGHRSRGHH